MKQTTELLSLFHVRWCRASVNGNPRWCFLARTPAGTMREIKTSTDNGWAYGCDIGRMKVGIAIRVTYHETRSGNLIADKWDDSRTAGSDLNAEFSALVDSAHLRATIKNPETPHQPVRL
jgi:hypothetical protein